MTRLLILFLLVFIALPSRAGSADLDDDLCNLPIEEGLSLTSTPDDVRAVFQRRGWVDESRP
jgi:hypothetical protein